ncbi:MAG TPA: GspE/PulE family protein [Gammaproteobacteria bacterium]|nr:GspE/PulE family protein [Gammaproteobacteria bacterium]
MANKKIHLGKLLLEQKLITQQQLDAAIAQQNLTGEKLGQTLVNMGFVSEDALLKLLSQQLDIPLVDVRNYSFDPAVVHLLPEFYARRFRCIILKKEATDFLIGIVDPMDLVASDELSRILKQPIRIALVRESDLLATIDILYRHTIEISSLAEELSAELGQNDFDVTQLGEGSTVSDAPVVKLLQTIFEDAVQVNASDVHIEPDENVLRIRDRIDGVLHEQVLKDKQIAQALTLRLKLMAGLNIAEKRLPQDGRFSIKVKGKNFDVRLSTMPTQFGESVVMRLLNQSAELSSLDRLGMPPAILSELRKLYSIPHGLILITGPTGSGKTTTLYGILNELNKADIKIITVEDPVEYRINRINQIQVQPKIDLTFSRVLRSVLRQDPDIIMIGELRDLETASIALRAAMTGHLVLSTLHTNDAISSTIRLIDMGVESYLVASILHAVLAQRLVRRNCPNCTKNYELTFQEKTWLSSIKDFSYSGNPFKYGTGCTYCHNTGYRGQIGLFELLEITEPLANALRDKNIEEFDHLAKKQKNFRPLLLSGLDAALQGVTSISEVLRIFGEGII